MVVLFRVVVARGRIATRQSLHRPRDCQRCMLTAPTRRARCEALVARSYRGIRTLRRLKCSADAKLQRLPFWYSQSFRVWGGPGNQGVRQESGRAAGRRVEQG
eukprot:1944592-Rhodomonas_salina.1